MPTMLSVYTDIVLLHFQHDLTPAAISQAMNEQYKTTLTPNNIRDCITPPVIKKNNAYLVHELRKRDLSAIKIAEFLKISVNTVYYHSRKFPKRPFVSFPIHTSAGALQDVFDPEYEEWEKYVRLQSAIRSTR